MNAVFETNGIRTVTFIRGFDVIISAYLVVNKRKVDIAED